MPSNDVIKMSVYILQYNSESTDIIYYKITRNLFQCLGVQKIKKIKKSFMFVWAISEHWDSYYQSIILRCTSICLPLTSYFIK